jgi:hypothetical protein
MVKSGDLMTSLCFDVEGWESGWLFWDWLDGPIAPNKNQQSTKTKTEWRTLCMVKAGGAGKERLA